MVLGLAPRSVANAANAIGPPITANQRADASAPTLRNPLTKKARPEPNRPHRRIRSQQIPSDRRHQHPLQPVARAATKETESRPESRVDWSES